MFKKSILVAALVSIFATGAARADVILNFSGFGTVFRNPGKTGSITVDPAAVTDAQFETLLGMSSAEQTEKLPVALSAAVMELNLDVRKNFDQFIQLLVTCSNSGKLEGNMIVCEDDRAKLVHDEMKTAQKMKTPKYGVRGAGLSQMFTTTAVNRDSFRYGNGRHRGLAGDAIFTKLGIDSVECSEDECVIRLSR